MERFALRGSAVFVQAGGVGTRSIVRNFALLHVGLGQITRTMDTAADRDTLESDLQMHVAEFGHDRVFVPASVVGWQGRAILLLGRSLAGKSTLEASRFRAGAEYGTDEYAVLDPAAPRLAALRWPD